MFIYLIIGIILITYTTIKSAEKYEDPVESMFSQLHWWVATVICVIFWPVLVVWAMIDIFNEVEGL